MSKLILCPNTDLSPALRISDNGSCSEMIWESGNLIDPKEHDLSRLEFLCETLPSGRMTDYAVSDMGCSVVSEHFKKHIESLGIDNIQYFRPSVIEREGEVAKQGYYAANIIGLVDCIDREASEMDAEYNDDDDELNIIYSIDKLVLKALPFSHGTLYRAFSFSRLILIDESLKLKFEQSTIEGTKLISPERWDGINGEITASS